MKKSSRTRDALNAGEVKALFDVNRIDELWGERMYYVANLLAACTGMRKAEIVGVRGTSLQDDHILVDRQYRSRYGLVDTKTYDTRRIPLPEVLMEELRTLRKKNGEGYLFSRYSGKKPVCGQTLSDRLRMAMVEIGISEKEQKDRYVSFHSWRHYFNTVLRSNNISDGKVQSLTGHKSRGMTEHYTHFKVEDYADVKAVQNKIVPFTKAG
ncbi:MAG: tyrosine-type recombinase/integrase [Spirochaetaceae bacterium]|nr:tyrosine-type recombinase/integrase [Spirochaetaceae bacterium]